MTHVFDLGTGLSVGRVWLGSPTVTCGHTPEEQGIHAVSRDVALGVHLSILAKGWSKRAVWSKQNKASHILLWALPLSICLLDVPEMVEVEENVSLVWCPYNDNLQTQTFSWVFSELLLPHWHLACLHSVTVGYEEGKWSHPELQAGETKLL